MTAEGGQERKARPTRRPSGAAHAAQAARRKWKDKGGKGQGPDRPPGVVWRDGVSYRADEKIPEHVGK